MFKDEFEIFMKAVPDYYDYLRYNPKSLIARIYGVFSVKMDDLEQIYLLLMGNTMKLENKNNLSYVFDLKGSMVNREVFVNK